MENIVKEHFWFDFPFMKMIQNGVCYVPATSRGTANLGSFSLWSKEDNMTSALERWDINADHSLGIRLLLIVFVTRKLLKIQFTGFWLQN